MTRTLLLADASITIQRVVELTFAHEDVRVVSVADGRRAMQLLEGDQPDVILADVDLPDVDGYALVAHVRRVARLKHVPTLLLAGAFEPVDQERARDVGSDGVIMKPFEPQVLVTRVKELIDQADRRNAPRPAARPEAVAGPGPVQVPPAVRSAGPLDAGDAASGASRQDGAFLRVAPRERGTLPAVEELPPVESLELPTRPIWEGATAGAPVPHPSAPLAPPLPAVAPPRVTLANAFTALLAAEQSTHPGGAPLGGVSEASIEDAVRRVLVRMTDDLVRRIVLDTAERLIREEIERIKSATD